MNSKYLVYSKYTSLDNAKGMIVLRKLPEPIRDFEEMRDIRVIFPCLTCCHPNHPIMLFSALNSYCCFEFILHVRCDLVFFWE